MGLLFDQYIESVQNEPHKHNRFAKLAVKRHLDDLKRMGEKDFEYTFDQKKADKAIKFISLLRHTKGEFARQLFGLQPWQAFIIECLFGWVDVKTGFRRFTKAYAEVPRKNGKSEFGAAIKVYTFIADNEYGAEVYTAATKKDQAKFCYKAAENMIRQLSKESAIVKKAIKLTTNNVSIAATNSFMRPLASDSDTEDGANPHCAIIDEYHAHPTDGMVKVIETGMGSRRQPLMFIITTAGYNRYSPCYTYRQNVVNILSGITVNDATFGIIFTLDDDDDWADESKWIKSNPSIGRTPYWRAIRNQYKNAETEGSTAEIEFKTKNLNIWTGTAETWIQQKYITACRLHHAESTLSKPKYQKSLQSSTGLVAALDLSSVRDTTSLSFYDVQNREFETHIFIPQQKYNDRKNRDGISYREVKKHGFLHVTDGNVIDYGYIKEVLEKKAMTNEIAAIAYDPFNSSQLVVELSELGFNMVQFRQGFLTMSPATKALEKAIVAGTIGIIYSPLIEYMFSNTALKRDPAGNVKPDKQKSTGRIDGVVSMIMAYGIAMHPDYKDVGQSIDYSKVVKF